MRRDLVAKIMCLIREQSAAMYYSYGSFFAARSLYQPTTQQRAQDSARTTKKVVVSRAMERPRVVIETVRHGPCAFRSRLDRRKLPGNDRKNAVPAAPAFSPLHKLQIVGDVF